jgi:hypothetical protein
MNNFILLPPWLVEWLLPFEAELSVSGIADILCEGVDKVLTDHPLKQAKIDKVLEYVRWIVTWCSFKDSNVLEVVD